MSKRATVQPRWLDAMLFKWGVTMPTARGWYNVCPMLQSGIPSTTGNQAGAWELTAKDFEQLHAAIDSLDHKHRCVIYRAYKPWTAPEQEAELAKYAVTPRTWYNWLNEAAALIEQHMAGDMRVCGNGLDASVSVKCAT